MLIIPAIDLKDGACVRLRQGRMQDSTIYSDDPVATASRWVDQGCKRLHLVDLDGAFAGKPENKDAVKGILGAHPNLPVQLGGGIRDLATVELYLEYKFDSGIIELSIKPIFSKIMSSILDSFISEAFKRKGVS